MRCHRGDDAIDPGEIGGAGHRLIVGDPIAIERRVGRRPPSVSPTMT